MGKNHIKRLVAPKSWQISRKSTKWITRPNPGPHKASQSISLNTVLKEFINVTKTTKETKQVLNKKAVKVDGKIRKDYKFRIGLMDTVSIEDLNLHFRILYNEKGKLTAFPIKKEEANIKPEGIIGKKVLRKKKIQINLSDGKNILSDEKKYKVNDTITLELSSGKIVDHFKFEEGSIIYIKEGNKLGKVGKIKSIDKDQGLGSRKIRFASDNKEFETLKDYALVIGKTKPVITIPK